jgi:hypothetical protein
VPVFWRREKNQFDTLGAIDVGIMARGNFEEIAR